MSELELEVKARIRGVLEQDPKNKRWIIEEDAVNEISEALVRFIQYLTDTDSLEVLPTLQPHSKSSYEAVVKAMYMDRPVLGTIEEERMFEGFKVELAKLAHATIMTQAKTPRGSHKNLSDEAKN